MLPDALEAQRRDPELLLNALRQAGASVDTPGKICCPWHEDRHASAGIFPDKDTGAWRFKCHTCAEKAMDVFDVRAKIQGTPVGTVLTGAPAVTAAPKRTWPSIAALVADCVQPATVYGYGDHATGKLTMVVVRSDPPGGRKQFRQASPYRGTSAWVMEAPPKPWRLYNSRAVATATHIVVCEGEKCVEALRGIGIIATTSPCGAGNAHHTDWSLLAGKKVFLWPDNDIPDTKHPAGTGIEHMQDVARILSQQDKTEIYWVDPGVLGLGEHGDVADYIQLRAAQGWTREQVYGAVVSVLNTIAKRKSAVGDALHTIDMEAAGILRTVSWPWPRLSGLIKSLTNGSITMVVGEPSAGKTYFLLGCLLHWRRSGEKVAALMLEEDADFYSFRAAATLSGTLPMADQDYRHDHPADAKVLMGIHQTAIDDLLGHITLAPPKRMTVDQILAWANAQAMRGMRIIAIDPITKIDRQGKAPAEADAVMIDGMADIARRFKISVVLASHSVKVYDRAGLGNVAGGADITRFSHAVIWISKARGQEVMVQSSTGGRKVTIDRIVHIEKARLGKEGVGVAFRFADARFYEEGIVVPQAKPTRNTRGTTPIIITPPRHPAPTADPAPLPLPIPIPAPAAAPAPQPAAQQAA